MLLNEKSVKNYEFLCGFYVLFLRSWTVSPAVWKFVSASVIPEGEEEEEKEHYKIIHVHNTVHFRDKVVVPR